MSFQDYKTDKEKEKQRRPKNFKKALMITVKLISRNFMQKYNKL